MIPTFSGSSRRPRRVDLRGANSNTLSTNPWSPSSGYGATQAVILAQERRNQRNLEKRQLEAAKLIQRVWRGHNERNCVKQMRRDFIDNVYRDLQTSTPSQRVTKTLPLLKSNFDPRVRGNTQRLLFITSDVDSLEVDDFQSCINSPYMAGFIHVISTALSTCSDLDNADMLLLLRLLAKSGSAMIRLLVPHLSVYYKVLARLCELYPTEPGSSGFLLQALLTPLDAVAAGPHVEAQTAACTYQELAFSFLVCPISPFLEANAAALSSHVDLSQLSAAILDRFKREYTKSTSNDHLLYLLAHFIALRSTTNPPDQGQIILKAHYTQLANLAHEISIRRFINPEENREVSARGNKSQDSDDDELSMRPLPQYVRRKLDSLVEGTGIPRILSMLSIKTGMSQAEEFEQTGVMSGYVLTLLRCFPRQGDDLRMQLFYWDIPTPSGKIPFFQFLSASTFKAPLYRGVVSDRLSPVKMLQSYLLRPGATQLTLVQSLEWRIMLLFLDMYTFLLRLSDDEDFFSGIQTLRHERSGDKPRIQACSLTLDELRDLTIYLKNLSFVLHHDTAHVAGGRAATRGESSETNRPLTYSTAATSQNPNGGTNTAATVGRTRLDFESLREVLTTAMRLIYERDSRRPFLPRDHWLMTSKFNMGGFISEVVLERERQITEVDENDGDQSADFDDDPYPLFRQQRPSRHAILQQMRMKQLEASRERIRATIGPKLAILRHMPFIIPFETRVRIFREFVLLDKTKRREGHVDADNWRAFMAAVEDSPSRPRGGIGRHQADIRRTEVFNDAYEKFFGLGDGLKEPIQITFLDQFGSPEAGIDGGGVTKEFLISVINETFQNDEWFIRNNSGCYYPNPRGVAWFRCMSQPANNPKGNRWMYENAMNEKLSKFEFLGRIIGKCMYEGILIDVAFAGFFLLKWTLGQDPSTGYRGNVNDLWDMDEDVYHGIMKLKNAADARDFDLDFTIVDEASSPKQKTHTVLRNLIPDGDKTPVTNDNRLLYISYFARHRLVSQPALVTRAFLRGLGSIIQPSWMSMFNQTELQRLVGGDASEIDVDDLRQNTIYSGAYQIGDDGLEHPTIRLFWTAMREFDDEHRRMVLKYVTSTPRAPLLGFSQLSPKFSIRDGGMDEERLPSAGTCVNLLKLPQYTSLETLRSKLLYAIESNAGFDLS